MDEEKEYVEIKFEVKINKEEHDRINEEAKKYLDAIKTKWEEKMELNKLSEKLKDIFKKTHVIQYIETAELFTPPYVALNDLIEEFPVIREIEPDLISDETYENIDPRILKNIERLNEHFPSTHSCGGHATHVSMISDLHFLKSPAFYTENDTYEKYTLCLNLDTSVYVVYHIPDIINIGIPLALMKDYILSPEKSRLYEKETRVSRDTCSVFVNNKEYTTTIMLNEKSVEDLSKSIQFEVSGDCVVLRQDLPFSIVVPFTEEGIKLAHSLFDKTLENIIGITKIMKEVSIRGEKFDTWIKRITK